MMLSNIKVVVNDNRAMIIIENPTETDLQVINEAFSPISAIKKLAGITIPDEPEPEIPVQSVNQQSVQQNQQPQPKTLKDPLTEIKNFLMDNNAQKVLGIKETIWKMSQHLYPTTDRKTYENWFDTSNQNDHNNMYLQLKKEILSA